MKRYDYERYEKTKKSSSQNRYYIFDRQFGMTVKIATVYDVDDAELICRALNERTTHEAASQDATALHV